MLTLKEAQEALSNRQPFNAGNLSARDNGGSYEVFSYLALIAHSPSFVYLGIEEDSKITPNAYNHSQTTSKHANIVKKAWGLN
jgi:hypothetical protein